MVFDNDVNFLSANIKHQLILNIDINLVYCDL